MWEVLTGTEADLTRPWGDTQMSFFTALLLFCFICHACKTFSWRRWQCVCPAVLPAPLGSLAGCLAAAVTREVLQVSPTAPRVALLYEPCPSGTGNALALQVKVKVMARVGMQ